MYPKIPDLEIWVVIQWVALLMIAAGLAQLSSLWVKRKWYGAEKHDRRDDNLESRGWIERFLKIQEQYVQATIVLSDRMQGILDALQSNGKTIENFTKSAECRFQHPNEGHDRNRR